MIGAERVVASGTGNAANAGRSSSRFARRFSRDEDFGPMNGAEAEITAWIALDP
jgi:hypothetical protein